MTLEAPAALLAARVFVLGERRHVFARLSHASYAATEPSRIVAQVDAHIAEVYTLASILGGPNLEDAVRARVALIYADLPGDSL